MKYTLSFNDEKFEVTEEDKKKIEQAVDDDMKFVQLSNGRTIDPLGVKEFKPVIEPLYFDAEKIDKQNRVKVQTIQDGVKVYKTIVFDDKNNVARFVDK